MRVRPAARIKRLKITIRNIAHHGTDSPPAIKNA
jgi:hypothetical protein